MAARKGWGSCEFAVVYVRKAEGKGFGVKVGLQLAKICMLYLGFSNSVSQENIKCFCF